MSIFNYKYGDEIFLHYCSSDIDLYNSLKYLNKYYYNTVCAIDNYKSWISFLDYSKKKNNKDPKNFKNNLFINACGKGNMVICNYLINKFNDINIHAINEFAFQLSCKHGYLEIAKWLLNLSMQKNFTSIDVHANCDLSFRWSCEYGHLEVAKWLIGFGLRINLSVINGLFFRCNSIGIYSCIANNKLDGNVIEWLRTVGIF